MKEVVIYDIIQEKARVWADEITEEFGLKARTADSLEEAIWWCGTLISHFAMDNRGHIIKNNQI